MAIAARTRRGEAVALKEGGAACRSLLQYYLARGINMTYEEWLKENDVDRDEYYSISDMRWFAEQAWKAAVRTVMDQERKGRDNKTSEYLAVCGCGEKMERIKPGKWQCNRCEGVDWGKPSICGCGNNYSLSYANEEDLDGLG